MSRFDQLSSQSRELIERYCDHLWMEKGLSENTLAAYRQDLAGYTGWQENRSSTLVSASTIDIQQYLLDCQQRGYQPRTSARILSSLRRLYAWLLREKLITADPTVLIEAPKTGRKLPASMSEQQVEALLDAPDCTNEEGLRDRCMLELMYATGLRVSELIALQYSQLSMDPGVIRIVGKGGKERLVPVGEEALDWLKRYLDRSRPQLANAGNATASLFITRRGTGRSENSRTVRRRLTSS